MKPAQIGDIAVCLRDSEFSGANIGKTCHVDAQCRCEAGLWEVTTLEPWVSYLEFGGFEFLTRCAAGTQVCARKSELFKKEDPDEDVEVLTSEPTIKENSI